MAEILWGRWQVEHIARRKSVTREDFDEAWHDPYRQDLAAGRHKKHGPYYRSVGATSEGHDLAMVWRWQGKQVWPITAYFPSSPPPRRASRKKKGGR